VTSRAEEHARVAGERGAYDLVVARSFASPGVTAECAAPLLRLGGHLVVSEPPSGDPADRWPSGALGQLGLGEPAGVVVDGPEPTHLVRIRLETPTADRYPRRVGIPAKRPLF
jgi:16S rRNA (guanine527-N7)-methyltransferase